MNEEHMHACEQQYEMSSQTALALYMRGIGINSPGNESNLDKIRWDSRERHIM